MAGNIYLNTGYWQHVRTWTPHAKLLYLWLWSNERANGYVGIGPADDGLVRLELGVTRRQYDEAMQFLTAERHVVLIDGWAWVVARAKYALEKTKNIKHIKGAARWLRETTVPPELLTQFWQIYGYLFEDASIEIRVPPSARDRLQRSEENKSG
ncbi:MAG: hypothetical protein HQ592_18560 [Planctomycetes bacterium]|nr:hypothetical protein [Planctomycetota bacterium]